ncbi:MAG TPA: hypothetical protein VGV90_17545 [Solirubrobacteraceae bacterium]|nr:hypothetical protein [Solirubrobacteraceae bacterium]
MITLASIIAFAAFEVLALPHGAESRPGVDERPERGHRRNI